MKKCLDTALTAEQRWKAVNRMLVTTKTTLSFRIPEEYEQAMNFEAEQTQEWQKEVASQWIIYTNEVFYTVGEGGEHE